MERLERFLIVFLQKNLTIKVEKTFLKSTIIWYAFVSKFSVFTVFEKIHVFSKETPKFRRYLRNITTSVAFYGKFAKIWSWLISEVRLGHLDIFNCQINVNLNVRVEWMVFLLFSKNGQRIATLFVTNH